MDKNYWQLLQALAEQGRRERRGFQLEVSQKGEDGKVTVLAAGKNTGSWSDITGLMDLQRKLLRGELDVAMMSSNDFKAQYVSDIRKIYSVYNQLTQKNGRRLPSFKTTINSIRFLSDLQARVIGIVMLSVAGFAGYEVVLDPHVSFITRAFLGVGAALIGRPGLDLSHTNMAGLSPPGYFRYFPMIIRHVKETTRSEIIFTIAHELAHWFRMPREVLYANSYEYLISLKLGYKNEDSHAKPLGDVTTLIARLFPGSLAEQEAVLRKFVLNLMKVNRLVDSLRQFHASLNEKDYHIPRKFREKSWTYSYGYGIAQLALMHYKDVDKALNYIYLLGKLGDSRLAEKANAAMRSVGSPVRIDAAMVAKNRKGEIDTMWKSVRTVRRVWLLENWQHVFKRTTITVYPAQFKLNGNKMEMLPARVVLKSGNWEKTLTPWHTIYFINELLEYMATSHQDVNGNFEVYY